MAQRTIHYLLGELLSREVELRDKGRFLLGCLLPDAYVRREDRDVTHFVTRFQPPERVCFDFGRFRQRFGERMAADELYLGYYMHLVQDCVYRKFNHDRGIRMPSTRQEIALLHQDYHILNAYIVRQYDLHNCLTLPVDFHAEPVCALAPFQPEVLLGELAEDFREDRRGDTHFLTPQIADEFIRHAMPLALAELKAAMEGRELLRAEDFATARMV